MLPGPTEAALMLVIVLILFSAGKLPEIFTGLGPPPDGPDAWRRASDPNARPLAEVRAGWKSDLGGGDGEPPGSC